MAEMQFPREILAGLTNGGFTRGEICGKRREPSTLVSQNKTKQWAYNGFVLVKGFSCWVGRGEHNDGSYAQILNAL